MPDQPERITLKKVRSQILEQLNLEKGLGYTIKQFLIRPRQATEEYLYHNRKRYIKPFSFLLLTTAITTFLILEFFIKQDPHIQDLATAPGAERIPEILLPGLQLLSTWMGKYFNLFYLVNLPIISIASYWVFRKKQDYNLAEYFVINTYVFSIQNILYILIIPFIINRTDSAWSTIPLFLVIFYFMYAYQQIFKLSIWQSLFYSMLIYLLAQVMVSVLVGLALLVGLLFV